MERELAINRARACLPAILHRCRCWFVVRGAARNHHAAVGGQHRGCPAGGGDGTGIGVRRLQPMLPAPAAFVWLASGRFPRTAAGHFSSHRLRKRSSAPQVS